jgi:hypothetical protein
MKIKNIITGLIILFFMRINKMPKFNRLDLFWVSYTALFINWLYTVDQRIRTIAMLIVLTVDWLRAPFIFSLSLLLTTVKGYDIWRCSSWHTLSTCMTLKFSGSEIPSKPTIYLANYPANFVEYQACNMLHPKICIIVYGKNWKETTRNTAILGDDRIISVVNGTGNFKNTEDAVRVKLQKGYHVLAYVEKNWQKRTGYYSIDRLTSGIFHIAKNIDATITPVVFDHIDHTAGLIHNTSFKIHIGKTTKVIDPYSSISDVSSLISRKLKHFSIK